MGAENERVWAEFMKSQEIITPAPEVRCPQRYVIQVDSFIDPNILSQIQNIWRMFCETGDMGLLILPPNCKLYRLQDAGPIEEVEVRGPDGKSHLLADKE